MCEGRDLQDYYIIMLPRDHARKLCISWYRGPVQRGRSESSMVKKLRKILYAALPVIGIASVIGVQVASAHGFFGGFASLTPEEIATRQPARFQQEAELLGVSADDVKAAWAEGKSFRQLMQEKGISEDAVVQRMKDAKLQRLKTEMQALVDRGIVTQQQADHRLEIMRSRVAAGGRMGMRFRGRGFGGFHF